MMKSYFASIIFLFSVGIVNAQAPKFWTAADIHDGIQKLNFLGSALYVAAHPDDENTRMISYLANEKKAEVAYLSLTRGDGGQNLIGTEIQELLGVIRTEELLAARRIDGGNQMFSRANDFGFSKHPDETLKIWNREEVLGDAVWAMRKWQPDVVINRFDHESAGKTHGHHTASAVLSYEAFDLAGAAKAYPEQLQYVDLWQPKRLYLNTSWWFYGSREAFDQADKSEMDSVNVGVYYPMKGKSNTEIAGESRSQHRCQGMGNSGSRGSEMEYLQHLKGEPTKGGSDIFEGINTTWTRVKGGEPIGKILATVEKTFDYSNPSASVPQLIKAYKLIKALPNGYWKNKKQQEIELVIEAALALYAEAVASDYSATPGEQVDLEMEIINRSPIDVQLNSVQFLPVNIDSTLNMKLGDNEEHTFKKTITLPSDINYTNPYWLNEKGELGMYNVKRQELRGLPETPRPVKVVFNLNVAGEPLSITKDVVYRKTDPVMAIVYRPFEITPPVFANILEDVYVYANNDAQMVQVLVKSGAANIKGTLMLDKPTGWTTEPEKIDFDLQLKGEEELFSFKLTPPSNQSEGFVKAKVMLNGKTFDKELITIAYEHIPTQTVLRESQSKVVKIDLKKAGQKVGYIMGAGDKIPESLKQIGYDVDLLEDRDMTDENLKQYDAIILGIRAYNTEDRLKFHQSKLLDYVKNGGTMIVQYNTNRRLKIPDDQLAPYPMQLSRDRVTVEEAEVRFLSPEHEVLNVPNKITQKDFEGWVQERGLYFADKWDDKFTAVLSSNDEGEDPKDGGLLVAKYGEGYYVYTGYSWFRELPAGVPGAYRIFTNLISLGNEMKP